MNNHSKFVSLLALAQTAVLAALSAGQVQFQTIALSGDAVHGMAPDVYLSQFREPTLNALGQTSFLATLAGNGAHEDNDLAALVNFNGQPTLVARQGEPFPGGSTGVIFDDLAPPVLNAHGRFAMYGKSSADERVVFVGDETSFDAAVSSTQLAADLGVDHVYLNSVRFNDRGEVALWASHNDTSAVYLGLPGQVESLLATSAQVPGTGLTVDWNFKPWLNSDGQFLVTAYLNGPGFGGFDRFDNGLLAGTPDAWSAIVKKRDPVPGAQSGETLSEIFGYALSSNNQIAFTADEGVFSNSTGTLAPIVRVGDLAPVDGAVTFQYLGDFVAINSQGQTIFDGRMDSPGGQYDTGLFFADDREVRLLARIGDPAPGTDPSASYAPTGFAFAALNAQGQVAFMAQLEGPGINGSNDKGVWATDERGLITLVAREGQQIDVDNDPLVEDVRTISKIFTPNFLGGYRGDDGGAGSYFNQLGQLALHLGFTDGSEGIIVATVPEPSRTNLLMCTLAMGFVLRKTSHLGKLNSVGAPSSAPSSGTQHLPSSYVRAG